jgi:putative nucleotidyltransferase with HDIG domain
MKSRFSWFPLLSVRKPHRRRAVSAARRRRTDGTVEVARPWWLALSPARVGLAAGTTVLLSFLLSIHLWPGRVALQIGETARETIVAPRTIRYEDTAQTRVLREAAAAEVPPQFDPDPGAWAQAREKVHRIYDALDRAARQNAGTASSAESLRRDIGGVVEDSVVIALLQQSPDARQKARARSLALLERAMGRPIPDQPGAPRRAREEVAGDAALSPSSAPLDRAVALVAAAAITPNQIYNRKETERQRAGAREKVPPQMQRLYAGSVVIRAGEKVRQEHLDKLAALGLQSERPSVLAVGVITLLVALLIVFVTAYLSRFHAALYRDTPRLFLLCVLVLISVVGLKIGSMLLGGLSLTGVHFGYLGMMCVASSGMAIALLLSPTVATPIVALLAVASGLILGNELRFTVITLASSLVGIVAVADLRNRGDLLRATLLLCLANVLVITLVGQLERDTPGELLMSALWGGVSGLFAVALFWIAVAAFEKPFGVTTHLRLLELSDPAAPLLQEFRLQAPGTYAHSLMVGSLAHAAAEAIGADGLLVRVAAYYHDIGKMSRPEFFIENQANAENVHDRLSPSMSALVLVSHVKDGVEMARDLGLPSRVCEVIEQHHGTSLMKYFYHRATGGVEDPTLEAQFRYAGPKPQSKEAAILMLADTVEAASRVLDKPTPARIRDFVARMVEEKRADGQLDECDLTLRDLKKIQDVFARTLSGALHARIEYPGVAPVAAPVAVAAPAPAGALTVVNGGNGGREEAVLADGDNGSNGDGSLRAVAPPGARGSRRSASQGG